MLPSSLANKGPGVTGIDFITKQQQSDKLTTDEISSERMICWVFTTNEFQNASTILSAHFMPGEDDWVRWDTHGTRGPSSVTHVLLESGNYSASLGFRPFSCKMKILGKH